MTNKRFEYKNHKVYDNLTGETHSSNMVSVNVLNELHEENTHLKLENEQLNNELFETRKDYILETYADNPIRRDKKLKALEKELGE